jgi:purine-binding chemotaxis protein CheW
MMATQNQFCTFYLDRLFFGVEVHKVQEVLRHQETTPVPLASETIGGLINLRGQIVTAIDLRRRLGLPERPADHLAMNVVLRCEDGAVSVLVDEIGDVVEVADDTFEPAPDTLKGEGRELIRGVHKLKGKLLHLLDTDKALTVAAATARGRA